MNIEGTVLEIIAKANGFKKIHENLYADKDSNKYQATQYGFVPNEIYNTETLVRQQKIETDKLQSDINKLNQKLDDAEYDKIVAEKEVEKLMQGNPIHTKELNKRAEWKQLVNHYEASKLKNERLSKKLSIYKDLFFQHFEDTKIREVNSILAELDAKEYIELFSGDLTEKSVDKCGNLHCEDGVVSIVYGEKSTCTVCEEFYA